jgi:MinD-like ATPase involved in chromosome partitioning or flagellar assembly
LYVITFYSFKGGVGRTMALVNTAAELARRGRKVLLVDFDLEAPGLNTYDLLRPEKPQPGIVEYVTEFHQTRHSPLVTDFLYEANPIGKKGGKLWVMPAGRGDAEYRRLLNALSWRKLYQEEDGFLLFEDTRLQWEAELHPDYVLIDARTGHTDIEGICTRQLADAVVVVFYPNEQNLAGLREVCQSIRAEKTSGLQKEITLHFVASNVPNLDDEKRILRSHLRQFDSELNIGRFLVIHRTETFQMLDQPIFTLQRPRSLLAREYRRLVDSLIMENSVDHEGAVLYLRNLERERALRQHWRNNRAVKDRLKEIESQFASDPEILLQLARWFRGQGDLGAALQHFDGVVTLVPERQDLLFERGRCRRQIGNINGAVDDLLHYLAFRSVTEMGKLPPKRNDGEERLFELEMDIITALEELFNVSFDAFKHAFTIPGLTQRLWSLLNSPRSVFFETTPVSLIREQRWEDAIRYLDIGDEAPQDIELAFLNFLGQRRFYLAMARWGETGTLSPQLCLEASEYLPDTGATSFQRLSLLCWGLGDEDGKRLALVNLDYALAALDTAHGFPAISCWTFREASVQEFRQHCEEQRRMIRGEPVRPAFLEPLR